MLKGFGRSLTRLVTFPICQAPLRRVRRLAAEATGRRAFDEAAFLQDLECPPGGIFVDVAPRGGDTNRQADRTIVMPVVCAGDLRIDGAFRRLQGQPSHSPGHEMSQADVALATLRPAALVMPRHRVRAKPLGATGVGAARTPRHPFGSALRAFRARFRLANQDHRTFQDVTSNPRTVDQFAHRFNLHPPASKAEDVVRCSPRPAE